MLNPSLKSSRQGCLGNRNLRVQQRAHRACTHSTLLWGFWVSNFLLFNPECDWGGSHTSCLTSVLVERIIWIIIAQKEEHQWIKSRAADLLLCKSLDRWHHRVSCSNYRIQCEVTGHMMPILPAAPDRWVLNVRQLFCRFEPLSVVLKDCRLLDFKTASFICTLMGGFMWKYRAFSVTTVQFSLSLICTVRYLVCYLGAICGSDGRCPL